MTTRINIVLPESRVREINRLVKPGERSRFIDRAVQHYIATRSPEALQSLLAETAERDRDLDREVASDWFSVDKQMWQRLDSTGRRSRATRGGGKSISRRSTQR
jgi:CopG family transcriptional regulator/antitoxin EndoAI